MINIYDKIEFLCKSIDKKGKVKIECFDEGISVLVKLFSLENGLLCDQRIAKKLFDVNYTFIKEQLIKKVRLLTEDCYRNSDCL